MSKVNLFVPCKMDMFSPQIPSSVISILDKIGDEVIYNPEQTCCGRCLYMQGEIEMVKPLAKNLFEAMGFDTPIVIPSTTCVSFIKNHYKDLLENTLVPNELRNFIQNTYELCYYLVQVKNIQCLENSFNHRVFYFKSCSARNYYKLENEPEILLKNTKGLELITDDKLNLCCGANGTFATANPNTSDALLEMIVDHIYSKSVQYITSTDIECLQHLDAYLNTKDIGLEVIHIADILNSNE